MAVQVPPDVDETWRYVPDMRGNPRVQVSSRRRRLWRQYGGERDQSKNQNVPPRGLLIGGTTLFMR